MIKQHSSPYRFAVFLAIVLVLIRLSVESAWAQAVSLDTEFTSNALGALAGHSAPYSRVLLQPDGKIIVAAEQGLVRFNTNGTKDQSFQFPAMRIDPFSAEILLQPDGKIIVAGAYPNFLTVYRFNTDGSRDMSFNASNAACNGGSSIRSAALLSDGKILIGGAVSTFGGQTAANLFRLNQDGTVDATFNAGGSGASVWPACMLPLPDGKILVGGFTGTYNDIAHGGIYRLNADGTLDESFNAGGGFSGGIDRYGPQSFALRTDGKYAVIGDFTSFQGLSSAFVAVVNPDGSPDISFQSTAVGVNGSAWCVAIQPDGKFLVGGAFSMTNSNSFTRFNADGTLDDTWNIGSGFNGRVFGAVIQPDGKIVVAGEHTTYNDTTTSYIARLSTTLAEISTFAARYSGRTFNESMLTNDGSISNTQIITLNNNLRWTSSVVNGTTLTNGVHYTVANLPAGLSLVLTKNSYQDVEIAITGKALSHSAANSINNVQITFTDAALWNGQTAASVVDLNGINLSIVFGDQPTASYSATTFSESLPANDGSIATVHTITLGLATWASTIPDGTVLTPDEHFTAANVPSGLTAVVTKISATQATISFTGNAANHKSVNNANNVQLAFTDSALEGVSVSSVQGLNGVNLGVTFSNPGFMGSFYTFPEDTTNDGRISTTRTVALIDEEWTSSVGIGMEFVNGVHYSAPTIPDGLQIHITKVSNTEATISFTGAALEHNAWHYSNTFLFTPQAFTSLSPYNDRPGGIRLTINFIKNATALYSFTNFDESIPANNGSIATIRTISLSATKWTSAIATGATLINGTHFSAFNIPLGLTAVVTKISDAQATIGFIGNAVEHQSLNSVNNVQLIFADAALSSVATANVEGLNAIDLSITFRDNGSAIPYAVYSDSVFVESGADDGTITTAQTITLGEEAWASSIPDGAEFIEGTHFIASGVPDGLTLSITRTSSTTAQLTFTGNATIHRNFNDATIVLEFLDAAVLGMNIQNVEGLSPKSLLIDFKDIISATYSGTTFLESAANNGSIATTQTITLRTATWSNSAASFTPGVHYSITNVPQGLTAVVTKVSQSTARISFTGNALNHFSANNVTNAQLTFTNAALHFAFTTSQVEGLNGVNLSILFRDPTATFSGTTFLESVVNNGSTATTQTITLGAATWASSIANGTTLTVGTHYTIANVPVGLTAVLTKISASRVAINLIGNAANHQNADNVNNVQITFTDAALDGASASSVQGLNGVNLSIVFIGKECNTVTTFAGNGASASVNGTGVAASFIDPYAVATDKSGNVYIADGSTVRKITPNGVVSTLTQSVGGNGIAIDGSGTIFTIEQTKINKITPAGVVTTVPTSGLTLSNGSDIAVDAFGNLFVSDGLNSIYKIAPTGVATKLNNQPVIAAGIAVDPLGNVYAGGYNTNKVYKIAPNGNLTTIAGTGQAGYADGVGTSAQFNQPVGLTLDASGNIYVMDYVGSRIRKITPGGVVSTIAGSGTVGYADGVGTSASFNYPLHVALDTTGNLFVTDRLNYRIRSINVCGASGALSGAAVYLGTGFQESTTNNGSIAATTSTIILGSVTWASSIANGTALTAGTHFTASNVPSGLTAVVTKISASQATISFTGNAASHLSTNNVNNVQLTFADAALNGVSASSVQGLNGVNLSIAYLNPGSALYSGTVFPEAAANDGTITTTRTITLFNEQWSSAIGIGTVLVNGSHYSAAGVPAGLLMSITKISGTAATISFTGTALAHQNANDALVTLTFTPQALASLTPSNQVGGLNKTLTIDFNDNPSASYSGTTFLEALPANNGTIATVRTVTLFAAQWTSTVASGSVLTAGTHYIASNVPAGLTVVITKISSTGATLSFTGNAVAHQSANSVSNVQITFTNAALSSLATSSVAGLNGVNLSVNFSDNAVASYSGTTFSEASANDGSVSTTRTVTLAFDTFVPTGVFTEGTHFTATGVPAGLVLTITRTSQSAAQIAFTGAAQAHENINDASVVLTFLNAAVVSGNAGAVTGLTPKTLTIDFADAPVVVNAPSAAYSGTMFAEAGANNGTVTTIRTVTLAFDTFVPTGAFTQGVHFTATGIPAGLTLAINRTSSEIAQISFTGAASAHENINDATVSLTFLNAAVASGNAAAVTGLTPKTLTIDFADTQALSSAVYSDSTFIESAVNNGSVITVNTLTLNGASFANVSTFTQGTHYTATGVPAGLSLVITRTGSSTAQVSFIGTAAAHANTNDATVMLTFLNAALVSGNASSISGLTPKRLFVDFADPTCGAVTTLAGNGNASVIDGAGLSASFADPRDVVTDAAGNIYVADKYCIRKITPSGVVTILAGSATASGFVNATGTAARFSDIYGIGIDAVGNIYAADYANACVRKITPAGVVTTVAGGNGTGFTNGSSASATFFAPHDVAADALGNLYVADLGNNAIRKISNGVVSTLSTSPVAGAINVVVDASGTVYVGGYSANKIYKVAPNGAVSVVAGSGVQGNANGTGTSASFGQPVGITVDTQGNLYVADYYPYNLIRKITPSGVVTTLAGTNSAGYADGTGTSAAFNYPWGLALDASGNLFIGDRFNQRIRSIYVCGASGQFPLAATYTGTVFPEAIANNGTITTTQTVTLGGTTWSSAIADGSGLVAGAHYTVSGVPAGLTLQITRTSPTSAVIAFIGAATAHANLNDASVVITFLDAAVANGVASAVAGLTPKTLTIDFNDPPIGASSVYSDVVFPEASTNKGQITATRTVTLTNASFASGAFVDGTHFTASGVPDGLTLAVTRLSATQARLAFTGTASAHALANSADVVLTFLPAVLTGGNVGAVADLTPKTLRVNFLDPYTASYSDTTFAESVANDGSVPTTRTVTLLGTTFTTLATTLVQGTHFNASGVPAGLTLTVTKLSPTVAQIAFSGSALAHVNDVNNITLSFLNAAIETGNATSVIGLTPKKLSIDFIAPYSATYSAKNFIEGPANDGSVPTTRLISLFGGDAWLPTTLLQGAHFTATGVPAGLTMVMTRTSSTGAQISFTGSATNHANINDASVSITFLPEALVSGNPSAVVGLTPATLTIDFRDPDVAPPSSPNILGFTPQVGTTGTVVTINGFGFTGTQNVLFGGAPAKSLTVVSDSVITAVVDYGSTGDVTVVNAQGLAILPGFTYVPRPTISSFTPTTGNAGAVVTINGANFQGTALNGTQWTTSSVYFGGTPATSFTVISPTQIQATVGAGATGAVRVETLPGNVGVRNGFCYMAPLITAFAPTSASTGTQVVITGSNFTGATAVKFNGKAAASFVVVSDTEITAFPATGTPLTGSISVTTPQCTDDLATFTFIPAPVIYGFWLSGGTDGDVITIDGINFTGATGVKFGDMVAASYTVVSPTRIQAVVGSGNTGAVTVIGPGGVGSRSKFIYYAPGAGRPNPPVITSFTPTEGPDGTVITITGLNFQGADWYTTAVRIGDAPPITGIIQSMTPTQLKVKVNGGNSGKITVYTPAGVTTSTMSFTYFPAPTISAFTPTTGAAGTTVTILGTEFTGVTSVKVGTASATSFTVDSPTQITAVVAAGTTGKVQVVASGGTATSSLNFTFPTPPPSPTLTTFSPAIATSGTVVTINGSNFTGATQVTFGGTPAQSFTVVNASRITALVGAGASGSVAVTTPSGSASKTGFTYLPNPLPTITSFSPASASPGQTVTILGTYFTGATQVFMGSASVPFTVIHSGKITVEVPTNAASGVIRVVTPNGVAMRSGFTVLPSFAAPPVPGIVAEKVGIQESMSVGVYPNPANESVTVTGTGFGDGRPVNLVVMNALGQTVLVLTGQSIGGTLQANVDVRDLPSGAYTVALSDGVLKQALRFVKQ